MSWTEPGSGRLRRRVMLAGFLVQARPDSPQRLLGAMLGLSLCACTVGEGSGWLKSERLYIEDCWDGPFDLQPTFFGANPYRETSLLIRVQRGDNWQEVSDGLSVLVTDISAVRDRLGGDIPVGLPPGVSPPGVPLEGTEAPLVSLALYLHRTCHSENSTIYALGGSIRFASLFSGDPNEKDSANRLTEAEFNGLTFADPRDLEAEAGGRTSAVSGYFRFVFQRGQPAQPFP